MIQINEIFKGVSGETGGVFFPQGSFCTFVRFQGCNLRCLWCDTIKSRNTHDGIMLPIDQVLDECNTQKVLITGGEPLQQREKLIELVYDLQLQQKEVQIETNGSFPLPDELATKELSGYVSWVVDYKLYSSGVQPSMLPLVRFMRMMHTHNMIIKFVFHTEGDIELMFQTVQELRKYAKYNQFVLSPTLQGRGYTKKVIKKIFDLDMQDYCVFSLQIHKILEID